MSSARYNVLSDDLNSLIVVGLHSLYSRRLEKYLEGSSSKHPWFLLLPDMRFSKLMLPGNGCTSTFGKYCLVTKIVSKK